MKFQVLGFATLILLMAIVISVLLLFVSMGVLLLIHLCIVGRVLRLGSSNSNNNNNDNRLVVGRRSHGQGSTSLSRNDLEKLPCFEFNAKEMKGSSTAIPPNASGSEDCAVCLENFKTGEICRLLPLCRHSFHSECVDMWLLRKPICPVCRATATLLVASNAESNVHGEMAPGNHWRNHVEMTDESVNMSMGSIELVANQTTGSLTESDYDLGIVQSPQVETASTPASNG